MRIERVGIIGGGAWGTALAQTLALSGREAAIWAYEVETIREINEHHNNRTFLPGVTLDQKVRATGHLKEIAQSDVILMVPPAQHLRRISAELAPMLPDGALVVACAKGIERSTGMLMGDVIIETLPKATPAILSGPSFAADVSRGLPAALTLACPDEAVGQALATGLGYRHFRIYWSSDVTGVQLGGAVKNVLAIAAGIVDGRGLGASAHAGLVTRGFAELRRLGEAMGARPDTLMGLSGLGDLVLTCGSPQSRNMSLGRALGEGRRLDDVLGARKSVTEGVFTAEAVAGIAKERNVEMPICWAVQAILSGRSSVDDAISGLLSRPMRSEA